MTHAKCNLFRNWEEHKTKSIKRSIATINELVENGMTSCEDSEAPTTTPPTTTPKIESHVESCLCSSVIYITDGKMTEQLDLIHEDAQNFHNCEKCRAALLLSNYDTMIPMLPIQEFYANLSEFTQE